MCKKVTMLDGQITLYCENCLDTLKTIPNEYVDAVVSDPPFGIGFIYEKKEDTNNPKEYRDFFLPFYNEMMRILKPGGFLALWQPALYFKYYWDWYGNDIHIYAACKNFVQLRKTPINYAFDPVIMKYKEGKPLKPLKPKRNVDFFVSNTAALVSKPNRPERQHPCPRPLDVVTEIINNFVIENGFVIDPFLGSGTTAIACLNTNRKCIGIEKELKYFKIAYDRLNSLIKQN